MSWVTDEQLGRLEGLRHEDYQVLIQLERERAHYFLAWTLREARRRYWSQDEDPIEREDRDANRFRHSLDWEPEGHSEEERRHWKARFLALRDLHSLRLQVMARQRVAMAVPPPRGILHDITVA
jgi:hypothetical protein